MQINSEKKLCIHAARAIKIWRSRFEKKSRPRPASFKVFSFNSQYEYSNLPKCVKFLSKRHFF